MALPASGQITYEQIATELGISTSNANMDNMTSLATGNSTITNEPDSTADWYGYSHAPPSAPTSHSISEDGLGNVNGSFTDNSGDEDGFRIEVEVNGLGYNFWGNNTPNDETYTAPGGTLDAVNNDEVQFRVRSYRGSSFSAWVESNLIILEQQV